MNLNQFEVDSELTLLFAYKVSLSFKFLNYKKNIINHIDLVR